MTNPNPNQPNYPYGGGTDNPGDDTSKAGGPTDVQATETAPLSKSTAWTAGGAASSSLAASVERHPPLPAGLSQVGTDTPLTPGQVIPEVASGFESTVDRGSDPEGGTDPSGGARESGQDEVPGASETTSGVTPSVFP